MEYSEDFTVDQILGLLNTEQKKPHLRIKIPMSDEFHNEFLSRIEGKDEEGQSKALYLLYQEYRKKQEKDPTADDLLLDAGIVLFNSTIRLTDDALSSQKTQLAKVIELTRHETIKSHEYSPALRIKALFEEVRIYIEKDHNFVKAFDNLKEIEEINKKHNIWERDYHLWTFFVINALEVYYVQTNSVEYKELILEVIEHFDRIDVHLIWDVVLKLMQFVELSEEEFKTLSKKRYRYFKDLNEKNDNKFESHNERTKRYMLGERLKNLALDSGRNEEEFERLNGFFLEDFANDEQGQEYLAEITFLKGRTDKDAEVAKEGISKYEQLKDNGFDGIDFHIADSKIKYHLTFTDFENEEERNIAKQDLSKSLKIVQKCLGDGFVDVFRYMISNPDILNFYTTRAISDCLEEDLGDRTEIKDLLGDMKQLEYLKDIVELILILYEDFGNAPLNMLNTALKECEVNSIQTFALAGGSVEVDSASKKPIVIVPGGTSGHVGNHVVMQAATRDNFQCVIPAGRSGSLSSEKRMIKTFKKTDPNFDWESYQQQGKLGPVLDVDFCQPDIGLSPQIIIELQKISQVVKMVFIDTAAMVDFLQKGDNPERIELLNKTNIYGVEQLYKLIQKIDSNSLLVHTGTFFNREGNNLYELSKLRAEEFLKTQNGNTLVLRPPIVGGQSAEGPNPYASINLDGPYVVMKLLYNLLGQDQQLVIDSEKQNPMYMVAVDKLAKLMIDLTLVRLASKTKTFEVIDCIGGESCMLTPQDMTNSIIQIYNILEESNLSVNSIGFGKNNEGFDSMTEYILNKIFPYTRANEKRSKPGIGFPDIGVDSDLFLKQIKRSAVRKFRQNGKVKYDIAI